MVSRDYPPTPGVCIVQVLEAGTCIRYSFKNHGAYSRVALGGLDQWCIVCRLHSCVLVDTGT